LPRFQSLGPAALSADDDAEGDEGDDEPGGAGLKVPFRWRTSHTAS
jgi:hypothetical protein